MTKHSLTLLFSLLLGFWTTANAQITFSQEDHPVIGTSLIGEGQDIGEVLGEPATGANQSWDFSNYVIMDPAGALNFVSPIGTDCQDNFPNASTASVQTDGGTSTIYFISQQDGFYIDGTCQSSNNISIPDDSDPNELLFPSPFTYEDTRSNTSSNQEFFEFPGGVQTFTTTTITTTEAVGYGTLITPENSYQNTLQIKLTEIEIDSSTIDFEDPSTEDEVSVEYDTTVTYRWLQKGSAHPIICELSVDGTVWEDITFFKNAITSIQDSKMASIWTSLSDGGNSIIIHRNDEEKLSFKIHNINGQMLIEEKNKSKLNISSLPTGLYLLQIKDEQGVVKIEKFIKP